MSFALTVLGRNPIQKTTATRAATREVKAAFVVRGAIVLFTASGIRP
jgi:hypothetical protein